MATSPAVTVIIPTYNWSSVLPYSIGSVLRQTFTDFELLVVGDGCTDDSEAVVNAIGDPRVRWINLPTNTGHQAGPNNEALRQARGEIIAYLGHDDLWLPHHLAILAGAIQAGCDLAYGVIELVNPDGSFHPGWPLAPYKPGMWIPPTGIVHRRSITEKIGGWRHYRELACDPETDLLQRAFAAGFRFVFMLRLTAIKFPAARRRDVYKLKPNHEQAAWSKRIQNNPLLEIAELVKMLANAQQVVWHVQPPAMPEPTTPAEGQARFERRRKFKGLDSGPP
jgi:glycosyltransferase involved in cell wall biosynthesis